MKPEELSSAAHDRLIRLYLYLCSLSTDWDNQLQTSEELAEALDATSVTVRKDLSLLGCPADGRGYRTELLREKLNSGLLLTTPVRAGLAGLDSWGAVLIAQKDLLPGIDIHAGFDSSMNRLEMTRTEIPLYPSYEITEIFRNADLHLGILASDGGKVQQTADRMIQGGARGLLNMTSRSLKLPPGIFCCRTYPAEGLLRLKSLINGFNGIHNEQPPRNRGKQ